MTKFVLTIAIPTYKRPEFLKQAIKSAIYQNNVNINYNIIIVNNDPTDNLESLRYEFKDSPIHIEFFTNSENLGMLGNVNRCVELSKGEWIAFLHDDDILLPNYVHEISKYLNDNNCACFIPRRYLLFDGLGRKSAERKRKIKEFLIKMFTIRLLNKKDTYSVSVEDNVLAWQNCYGAPSCGTIFNKNKLMKVGLFSPPGTYAWDFLSFIKLNKVYEIRIINEILSVYRMSTGASIRPEVQLDFYKSFDYIRNDLSSYSKECAFFIKRFFKEISYLNMNFLSNEAISLLSNEGVEIVSKPPSLFRFIFFMFLRIKHFAVHHLDVELTLDKDGKKVLEKMQVL